jgi:hypothetical protein
VKTRKGENVGGDAPGADWKEQSYARLAELRPDPLRAAPCPYCGYDVQVQAGLAVAEGRRSITCSECGHTVARAGLLDEPEPLVCERLDGPLALVLLPIDFVRLLWPWNIAGTVRGRSAPRGHPLLVLAALSAWLAFAALLCALTSIAVYAEDCFSCPFPPRDPLDASTGAASWVADYLAHQPRGTAAVAIFAGALSAAHWILGGALFLFLRSPDRRRCDHVGFTRRVVIAFSPVVCVLLIASSTTLAWVGLESILWIGSGGENRLISVAVPGAAVSFLAWLSLTGYAERGPTRVGAYLYCGVLTVCAWFGIVGLGGLAIGLNFGQLVHLLRIW